MNSISELTRKITIARATQYFIVHSGGNKNRLNVAFKIYRANIVVIVAGVLGSVNEHLTWLFKRVHGAFRQTTNAVFVFF